MAFLSPKAGLLLLCGVLATNALVPVPSNQEELPFIETHHELSTIADLSVLLILNSTERPVELTIALCDLTRDHFPRLEVPFQAHLEFPNAESNGSISVRSQNLAFQIVKQQKFSWPPIVESVPGFWVFEINRHLAHNPLTEFITFRMQNVTALTYEVPSALDNLGNTIEIQSGYDDWRLLDVPEYFIIS